MVGYEHSEMLGPGTFARCVAEEDEPFLRERISSREEGAYVITAVRKDGSRFRAELHPDRHQQNFRALQRQRARRISVSGVPADHHSDLAEIGPQHR